MKLNVLDKKMNPTNEKKFGYDILANEYYDSSHKTCRNFDYTTKAAIEDLSIKKIVPRSGMVLEVGCGRGRCSEFLGISASRIVQLDSSRKMLALEDREQSIMRIHADATAVPLFDQQFSAVIGFLVDSFIGLNFLKEVYRLLKPGGLLLATTPTPEWGHPLRVDLEFEVSFARFITKKEETVIVASTLNSDKKLNKMLQQCGFEGISVTSHCLPENAKTISPDIKKVADKKGISVYKLPIVHLIRAFKIKSIKMGYDDKKSASKIRNKNS
ncbi:MAG: class I SAM-dependent methyltransferase [bacterium]